MVPRFQRVRNIHRLMGTFMKIGWIAMKVHNISSIYNNICNNKSKGNNNKNNKHKEVYKLFNYRWKEWEHKLL